MRIRSKEQTAAQVWLPRLTQLANHRLAVPHSVSHGFPSYAPSEMPSFCFSAVVRTADPTLLLDITHFLVQNSPSETIHKVRGNVPENVDVLLASDLVITLSGTLDHVKIPSADIAKSTVTLHFKRYLETAREADRPSVCTFKLTQSA